MTDTLIQRLRRDAYYGQQDLIYEAADALEQQAADLAYVKAASVFNLMEENKRQAAQIDALRADAERLKFLREKSAYVGINPHARTCLWVLRGIYEIPGQGFDAAIDAALRQEQPHG